LEEYLVALHACKANLKKECAMIAENLGLIGFFSGLAVGLLVVGKLDGLSAVGQAVYNISS
jgi:hypothetical protein